MKAWICVGFSGSVIEYFLLFIRGPDWDQSLSKWSADKDGPYGHHAFRRVLERDGFNPLPVDDECNEYDLSGAKPRLVKVWVPA
jgi:hypothetical protein